MVLKKAMVMAAGRGERMRPLTNTCPKPMLRVGGKPMIAWSLEKVFEAGIEEVRINVSHLGEQIVEYFSHDQRITFSREPTPLEGAGVTQCLDFFGREPFFLINGDILWCEGRQPILHALGHVWNPEVMDVLLGLVPIDTTYGYAGRGDYFMEADGQISRRMQTHPDAPFVFSGVQIMHPRALSDFGGQPFRLTEAFDKAQQNHRLYGLVSDMRWYHLGTPQDYDEGSSLFLDHQTQREG